MRIIRKLFFCSLVVLLCWLGIYVYNRVTDGFSIYQMTSSLPPSPQYEVNLTPEKKASLQAMLNQPFRYIGKGCQFYVFSSADDKIVIKFLKHKHLRPFTWLNTLPMPQQLRSICDAKIARRKERVERLFASCKLAYEKIPEETGLLWIHLNRTPALEKKIILIDKVGFKHTLNIDDYEFVIQKKGIPLKEAFSHLQPEEIPHKIEQLTHLVITRCNKGICDRDRSFAQNVAFSPDGPPLFIDIGQFYEDPLILTPEEQAKELTKRLGNLHHWINRHFPEFTPS